MCSYSNINELFEQPGIVEFLTGHEIGKKVYDCCSPWILEVNKSVAVIPFIQRKVVRMTIKFDSNIMIKRLSPKRRAIIKQIISLIN